jgi:1,4-alpha-glucan branching enzyme
MKGKNKTIARGVRRDFGRVCLRLTRPTAQEVCVAGSFNDWHPSVTPMIRLDDGTWAKELALAPGRYEYRFVVDGQWVDDPAALKLNPKPFRHGERSAGGPVQPRWGGREVKRNPYEFRRERHRFCFGSVRSLRKGHHRRQLVCPHQAR